MDAKEEFKKWIFEGNCPCCFPHWDFDCRMSDVWGWQDEFRAWDVYDEILGEDDD